MATKPAGKRQSFRSGRGSAGGAIPASDAPFFFGVIIFLIFSLGAVIVAQKVALKYITREFPRVAEYNYRALQVNLRAVEARLTQQLAEVNTACISAKQQLPPNPAPIQLSVPPEKLVP